MAYHTADYYQPNHSHSASNGGINTAAGSASESDGSGLHSPVSGPITGHGFGGEVFDARYPDHLAPRSSSPFRRDRHPSSYPSPPTPHQNHPSPLGLTLHPAPAPHFSQSQPNGTANSNGRVLPHLHLHLNEPHHPSLPIPLPTIASISGLNIGGGVGSGAGGGGYGGSGGGGGGRIDDYGVQSPIHPNPPYSSASNGMTRPGVAYSTQGGYATQHTSNEFGSASNPNSISSPHAGSGAGSGLHSPHPNSMTSPHASGVATPAPAMPGPGPNTASSSAGATSKDVKKEDAATGAPSGASSSTPAKGAAGDRAGSSSAQSAGKDGKKPISMVVIACRQCRARKIRCDSTRPQCHNCVRRSNVCEYDTVPKRRGPDKRPGTRQRSCKKRQGEEGESVEGGSPVSGTKRKREEEVYSTGALGSSMGGMSGGGYADMAGSGRRDVAPHSAHSHSGHSHHSHHQQQQRALVVDTGMGGGMGYAAPRDGYIKQSPVRQAQTHMEYVSPTSAMDPHQQAQVAQQQPRYYDKYPSHPSLPTSSTSIERPASTSTRYDAKPSYLTGDTRYASVPSPHANQGIRSKVGGAGYMEPGGEYVEPTSSPYAGQRSASAAGGEYDDGSRVRVGNWWEVLLNSYGQTREGSLKDIVTDLQFLYTTTSTWLSFVNPNLLVRNLYSDHERSRMNSAFIYASLALATLIRSSEIELSENGRRRAMWLRDAAQAELDKAYTARLVDVDLAQAAFLIAFFESSAHPQYSSDRAASSLIYLDNVIRMLGLAASDATESEVSLFMAGQAPAARDRFMDALAKDPIRSSQAGSRKCQCLEQQGPSNPQTQQQQQEGSWTYSPPWDERWSAQEVKKEITRRLVWSALSLISAQTVQGAIFHREPPNMYLTDPANYALLFPGELTDRLYASHHSRQPFPQSPKDSIWAIYCRSLLLWNFCLRLRSISVEGVGADEKGQMALDAWQETQALEDSLEMHVCNLDTALLYNCREYVYNTRLTITQTLRRFVPHTNALHSMAISGNSAAPVFTRKQAEEWLYYQDNTMKRIKVSTQHLNETQGHLLTRRPFLVPWFSNQLTISISLWNHDRTLIWGLELGKSILYVLDILNIIWPCHAQLTITSDLRRSLTEACQSANIALPGPKETSLNRAIARNA